MGRIRAGGNGSDIRGNVKVETGGNLENLEKNQYTEKENEIVRGSPYKSQLLASK